MTQTIIVDPHAHLRENYDLIAPLRDFEAVIRARGVRLTAREAGVSDAQILNALAGRERMGLERRLAVARACGMRLVWRLQPIKPRGRPRKDAQDSAQAT